MTKPRAARTHKMFASVRVALSPRGLENAHEPAGQIKPGCNLKYLALCPKYSRWTRPCSIRNTPTMILAKVLLPSDGKVQGGL